MFSLTVSLSFLKISTKPTSVTQLKPNCIQSPRKKTTPQTHSTALTLGMKYESMVLPYSEGGERGIAQSCKASATQGNPEDSLISTPVLMPWAHWLLFPKKETF